MPNIISHPQIRLKNSYLMNIENKKTFEVNGILFPDDITLDLYENLFSESDKALVLLKLHKKVKPDSELTIDDIKQNIGIRDAMGIFKSYYLI